MVISRSDSGFIASDLLPEAFLSKMQELLTEDEFASFLSSYDKERLFSLRINSLKTDFEKALDLLHLEQPDQVPWEPAGFYYQEDLRPGRLPWHEAGMYYIQEASAMAPAMLCGVKPGERVLDLCAAPGGKSTKLAACLSGKGILVANEIHPERAKVLSSNLERMGVRNALVTNETPQRLASRFPLFFDRIVVDAPCSGEGMFRKEVEALKNWSPENVRMCAERQSEILEEAASMLRPGGTMVYSTCTFSPEENEGVIYQFLMKHSDISVVNIFDIKDIRALDWGFAHGRPEWIVRTGKESDERERTDGDAYRQIYGTIRLWPHLLNGEGHFAALLRKEDFRFTKGSPQSAGQACRDRHTDASKACGVRDAKEKKRGKGPRGEGSNRGKKQNKELTIREARHMWEDFCKKNLLAFDSSDIVPDMPDDRLLMFGSALYMLPKPVSKISMEGLRVLRAGLQLGTLNRGHFEPSHALAMALRREEVCRFIEYEGDSPQAYAWIRGESVSVGTESEKGWTLVLIDGCSAGWGKLSGGILKNHYPKGLRKGNNYRSTEI